MATSGTLVFSNANGVSFGMSGSSRITASASVPAAAISYWDNKALPASSASMGTLGSDKPSAFFQRMLMTNQLLATLLKVAAGPQLNTTYTLYAAIYTMAGSTLSRASSASFTMTSAPGPYTPALISLGTWSITPGEYMMQVGGAVVDGYVAYYGQTAGLIGTGQFFQDAKVASATQASYHLTQLTNTIGGRPFLQFAGTF